MSFVERLLSTWARMRASAHALNEDLGLMVLAAIWLLVMFVAFRPGLFSNDSITHVLEASARSYGDWQPPLVGFLLGRGTLLAPWIPLLAHLLLLATTTVLLARLLKPRWLAMVFAAVMLFLPPVWAVGTAVWKDVSTAGALLVACVALVYRKPTLAFVAAVIVAGLRHNAVLALPPICFAIAGQYVRGEWYRRAALTLVLLLACACSPSLISRVLRDYPTSPVGQIFLHDLAAIYSEFPEDFATPTSCLSGTISPAELARGYTPAGVNGLIWTDREGVRVVPPYFFHPKIAELTREWQREITRHPGTYVRHRLRVWAQLLRIGEEYPCYPFHEDIAPNNFGLRLHKETLVFRFLDGVRHRTDRTLLFHGWPWLALCSILAGVGWWTRKRSGYAWHVALSGVLYALAYIPTVPCCDFRFLYWTVMATLAAALLIVSGVRATRAGETASRPGG